jgi:hypothetical protein
MQIFPTDVARAFTVQSGSTNLSTTPLTVDYIKYNEVFKDVPLTLGNTSDVFYIKMYPIVSTTTINVFPQSSSQTITQATPLIIPPTSSKQVFVRVTEDLNNLPDQTIPGTIKFFLSAMVPSGSTLIGPSQETDSSKFPNGSLCSQNSECQSGHCDNPENKLDAGICKDPPPGQTTTDEKVPDKPQSPTNPSPLPGTDDGSGSTRQPLT